MVAKLDHIHQVFQARSFFKLFQVFPFFEYSLITREVD